LFNKPFFKEFAVKGSKDASLINSELLKNDIIGGYDLSTQYASLNNALLLCVTEKRSKDEIHKLIDVMEGVK
jgi:glycine dehydrogenase subunit 1